MCHKRGRNKCVKISEHKGITQTVANPGRLINQVFRLSLEDWAGSVHVELIKITSVSGA